MVKSEILNWKKTQRYQFPHFQNMGFFCLNLMSIPAMLFLWFCHTVTFFKFFCLSDVGEDCNGQMKIKLSDMKLIIINYQKDTVLYQIIFQIMNSMCSIWISFFINPTQNLGVKSFLGQWLLSSLVHQIWVSFKMNLCCPFYDSSNIFTNTTFFIWYRLWNQGCHETNSCDPPDRKSFQSSKIFKMLFCKLVIKINSQP